MPVTPKLELKLFPNEYWWGGLTRHGDRMPFSAAKPYRQSLYQNLMGNQGCPLLVSSQGRYIWSEEPFALEFKDGWLVIDEALGPVVSGEGYGNLRGAYRAACQKFFPPSGRIPHPLSFTAPQYNSWIDVRKYPTQEKTLRYAQSILEAGLPPGVLMIDDFWYKHCGQWQWDPEAFPQPKEMVAQLHQWGFLVMLWICPWVTPDTRQYQFLEREGYLLTHRQMPLGDDQEHSHSFENWAVIQKWWNGFSAVLDLSNPAAMSWLQGELDVLVEQYGIDGFKFDGGDPYRYLPAHNSSQPRTPNGHCEDFARIGLKYDLSEYRACWKLGGQHLLQRVRDKAHIWGTGGLADTLPTSLAQGIVGYPYTCPDMVGGGEITYDTRQLDQELFVRWAQSATFFPVIQYSLLPNRVLDSEHLQHCLNMIGLRKQMGPELLALARDAARTGEPLMRYLAYSFPECGLEEVKDQFMLGDKYLIAPVLRQGQTRRLVRFPPGKWLGDDGSVVQGPGEQDVEAPLARLPWYTRQA
jgi:alpha-glucosidase (family GH31 glycosyl hydrolase)